MPKQAGKKLAKMTEEERLLYMQQKLLEEEEMQKKKEDMLSQFLKVLPHFTSKCLSKAWLSSFSSP